MWPEVDRLADGVGEYLRFQGHWVDRLTMCQTALDAAQVEGKTQSEARWLNNMGGVYSDLGEKQKALEYFNQSLP
ncbi:MAG: tetratricopeptide repeat protein, partial [Chloroflexota bacterium]